MSPHREHDTLVAQLTPPGKAAIASLGLYGPMAWKAVRQLFRPACRVTPLPEAPEAGSIWHGWLGENTADEVVINVKDGPPVPWVEIHCHGGHEIIRLLLGLFERQGVKICDWATFKHFAPGKRCQAQAANALAGAITTRTASILLDQSWGALLRDVEAILDAWGTCSNDVAGRLLGDLAARVELGRHLTTPWRVVVAGAPNVGKSSLVNALAGYQRCVVDVTPGTTRDVVHTVIAVNGWPMQLADTAGFREDAGLLEQEGMGLARAAAAEADLCLWLVDAAQEPLWPVESLKACRIVINKVDLCPSWDLERAADASRLSATTGAGLEDLCQRLSNWLVPVPPPAGAGVPFTEEVCRCVEAAWKANVSGRPLESERRLQDLAAAIA